ncbi:MAG: hypothetical protein COZ06_23230 [Armatimonadetes bacterium CG_4_10_14_3_um_filter_66_18]|nr:MAG: hypothetical protein COZ06_23230 [Armatimonadetes bacterium CG_4_10_14_3_um_filter_66_18]
MHPRREADTSGVVALDHGQGNNTLVPAQRGANRLSLCRRSRGTVLLCQGLWFVLPCVAAQDTGESAIPGWPKDAPIQVWTRSDEAGIGRAEAEQLAARYLGVAAGELKLQRAYLTDDDFPYLRPEKLPVWLAEATSVSIPPRNASDPPQAAGKPELVPRLYLAIDAATGQCIEAFTAPTTPWWTELRPIGKPHEDWCRDDGVMYDRPGAPPRVSLTRLLRVASLLPDTDGQIVVRYVLYSDFNTGIPIERVDVPGIVPVALQELAWVVMREYVELTPTMPDGLEYIGRVRLVVSARTGSVLSSRSYGGPRKRPND